MRQNLLLIVIDFIAIKRQILSLQSDRFCLYCYFNLNEKLAERQLEQQQDQQLDQSAITLTIFHFTQKTSIKWIKFCANLNNVSERSAGGPWFESRSRSNQEFSLIFDCEMYVIAVSEVTLLLLLWTLISKYLVMLLKV